MNEYDATQLFSESIRRAEEAARALASHRPEQPWSVVADNLKQLEEVSWRMAENAMIARKARGDA